MADTRTRQLKATVGQENVPGGTKHAVLKAQALQGGGLGVVGGTVSHRTAFGDLGTNKENNAGGINLGKKTDVPIKPVVRKPFARAATNRLGKASGSVQGKAMATVSTSSAANPLTTKQGLTLRSGSTIGTSAAARPIATSAASRALGLKSSNQQPQPTATQKLLRDEKASSQHTQQDLEVELVEPTTHDVKMQSPAAALIPTEEQANDSLNGAFSTDMLANMPNIDEGDEDNPLMVSEYVNDIYSYLRRLEASLEVKKGFLTGKSVNARMRCVLVDWLVQVQMRFQLLPETLYMTISLLDRYLQAVDVPKKELQLVGVTAMFVASKYEEIYPPEINDFVYISDDTCSADNIRVTEIKMLQTCHFKLGRPLPIHFLRRFSKAADANGEMHTLAKYLCELSLIDYSLSYERPSLIAAAASYMSLKLLADSDNDWDSTMQYYARYTEADLTGTVDAIVKALIRITKDDCKYKAVKNKFNTNKFMKISQREELSTSSLLKMFPTKK